jgi:hypothetical protein
MAVSVPPMRTRFDQFGKQMLRAALARRGPVESEAEVPVSGTRRIDLWFMPDAARAAAADELGLLGHITAAPCTIELFHDTPGADDLAACVVKHGEFRRYLALRESPPPVPMQWVISSGRPRRGIAGLGLRPMAGWPPGVYEAPPLLWTRLVVVSELPTTPDTLLLRLLGAGSLLTRAIAELEAMRADAPERVLALPILVRLRLEIPRDPAQRTADDEEFLMDTQDIVENWRREAVQEGRAEGVQEGRAEGVQEGRAEGVQEGRAEGVQRALIDIIEARYGAVPDDVHSVIEDTRDDAVLHAWVKLAATRSRDEIIAAIRAVRRADSVYATRDR